MLVLLIYIIENSLEKDAEGSSRPRKEDHGQVEFTDRNVLTRDSEEYVTQTFVRGPSLFFSVS